MRRRASSAHRRRLGWAVLAAVLAAPLRAGELQRKLDAELEKLPKGTRAALVIEELGGGRLYARAADEPMKPASVLKLFTTAAALIQFGPDFRFRTEFALHQGDVLVIGAGDPGLGDPRIAERSNAAVTAVFDRLADELRRRGVNAVGCVALDDSRFDQQVRHPDWPDDQQDQWYQAPVGALNFNDNCLDAVADVDDGRVVLELTPPLPGAFYSNQLVIAEKGGPVARRPAGSDTFEFTGQVRRRSAIGSVAARDPTIFFGYALLEGLQRRGITVRSGVVRRHLLPAAQRELTPLFVHDTSLRDVIWRANTHSQNLFAECLVKALAAYGRGGRPSGVAGGWQAGTTTVRSVLQPLGVNLDGAILRDGSGLSHDNRVSASQVVALVQSMHRTPHWEVFFDSLADAGREGTMQRSYGDKALVNRLKGKTGTISGVRTLAGVIERSRGTRLVFALLVDGQPPGDIRQKIAKLIAEH